MVLDRCTSLKPDIVFLPIQSSSPYPDNKQTVHLKSEDDITDFVFGEILNEQNVFKLGRSERVVYERVNGLK